MGATELSGGWRAAEADEELRRQFPSPNFDDSRWASAEVPGHWRMSPPFEASDGPLLYRHRFESGPLGDGDRAWLVMEGVFYHSDIWLDGSYLGDTEGYFFPHELEVTSHLKDRRDHVLAVEVGCERPGAGRALMGIWDDPTSVGADFNPGGIWAPVRLLRTGPVRISSIGVACTAARPEGATLEITAVLDTNQHLVSTVRAELRRGPQLAGEMERRQPLALGANRLRWRLDVPTPELWWPAGLGPQALYDFSVSVSAGGALSDARSLRTGLRQVGMRNFRWTINGEALFLKGANLRPTRRDLASVSQAQVARDVAFAREAGLNLVRTRAHVARSELYAAADEAGLLVWQDMPVYGRYRGGRRQAMRQAAKLVEVLGHHPSVIAWCAQCPAPPSSGGRTKRSLMLWAGQVAPSAGRSWTGASVRRALDRADPSRPALARPALVAQWYGWERGGTEDLRRMGRLWPSSVRFVADIGAQAVPDDAIFMVPEDWPKLDWEHLATGHCMQKHVFDERVPPANFETFDAWRRCSQSYQAELVREQVEALRLLRNGAAGGFCVSSLNDAQDAVSSSLLDAGRHPKAAFEALRAACQPVIVVATWRGGAVGPGSHISVHVINDLATPLSEATVEAKLTWPAGGRLWRFSGAAPARRASFVARLVADAPESALRQREAELVLKLTWRGEEGSQHVENRYLL